MDTIGIVPRKEVECRLNMLSVQHPSDRAIKEKKEKEKEEAGGKEGSVA